ncbi:MAG TPA: hypothetical protein VGC64_01540 [Pyrinomonadaceae bacterium]|jgi:hypothetical protein
MSIEERVIQLENAVQILARLAAKADRAQDITDDRLEKLTQLAVSFDERLDSLAAAQENSESKIAALADAQIRFDERMDSLAAAQENSESRIAALADAQIRTEATLAALAIKVDKLADIIGG